MIIHVPIKSIEAPSSLLSSKEVFFLKPLKPDAQNSVDEVTLMLGNTILKYSPASTNILKQNTDQNLLSHLSESIGGFFFFFNFRVPAIDVDLRPSENNQRNQSEVGAIPSGTLRNYSANTLIQAQIQSERDLITL